MNIEPALLSFINRKLVIARATFAKNANEQDLTDNFLLILAGMGLAKAVRLEKGEISWIRTEILEELERMPTVPEDLTPYISGLDKNGEVQMMESLRLILADMVMVGQKNNPESAENITVDSTLLALAGQGLASFVKVPGGKWIWVANAELIDRYELSNNGVASLANRKRPKLLIDDLLKGLVDFYYGMLQARLGGGVSRREAVIAMLQTHETTGDVIAYKDKNGRLAWKASVDFRHKLNRSGD